MDEFWSQLKCSCCLDRKTPAVAIIRGKYPVVNNWCKEHLLVWRNYMVDDSDYLTGLFPDLDCKVFNPKTGELVEQWTTNGGTKFIITDPNGKDITNEPLKTG